ncbi:MAG TPA: hypothetical protein VJC09_02540 [Candidatus Saccharimonadales bacterium]|nr:hypothetical protein [Candidatus Saccharimonadales bacterium]
MTHEGFPGTPISVGGDFVPPAGQDRPADAEHTVPTALDVMDHLPETEHFADLPNDAQIKLLRTDRFNYLHSQAGLPTLQEYVDSPDSHIPRAEFDAEFSGELSPRGFLLDKDGNETSHMPWHLTQFDVDPDRMDEDAETAYRQYIAEQKMARALDSTEDTEVSARPVIDDEPTTQMPPVEESAQPKIDSVLDARRLHTEHSLDYFREELSKSRSDLEKIVIRKRIGEIEQELEQINRSLNPQEEERRYWARRNMLIDRAIDNPMTLGAKSFYPDMDKRREAQVKMIESFRGLLSNHKPKSKQYQQISATIEVLEQELAQIAQPSRAVQSEKIYYEAEVAPLSIAWQGLRAAVSEHRAKRAESKLNKFNQRARVAEQAADVIEERLDGSTEAKVTRRFSGRKNKRVARNAELTSQVLDETPTELLSQVRAGLQQEADKLRVHGKEGTKIRHYTNKHTRLAKQAADRRGTQTRLRARTTPVDVTGWASAPPTRPTMHESTDLPPPGRLNHPATWSASEDGIAPEHAPTTPIPTVVDQETQAELSDEAKEGTAPTSRPAKATEFGSEAHTSIEYTTLRRANEEALEKWRETMNQYSEGTLEYKLAEGAVRDLEAELAQTDKQAEES